MHVEEVETPVLEHGTSRRSNGEVLIGAEPLTEGELRLGHDDLSLAGLQRVDLGVGVGDEVDLHTVDEGNTRVAGIGAVRAVVGVVAHHGHLNATVPAVEHHRTGGGQDAIGVAPLDQVGVDFVSVRTVGVGGIDLAEGALPAGEELRPADAELGVAGDVDAGDELDARCSHR